MTGRKNGALQVPYVVPYKAFRILPRALYGTTIGTYEYFKLRFPIVIKVFISAENR